MQLKPVQRARTKTIAPRSLTQQTPPWLGPVSPRQNTSIYSICNPQDTRLPAARATGATATLQEMKLLKPKPDQLGQKKGCRAALSFPVSSWKLLEAYWAYEKLLNPKTYNTGKEFDRKGGRGIAVIAAKKCGERWGGASCTASFGLGLEFGRSARARQWCFAQRLVRDTHTHTVCVCVYVCVCVNDCVFWCACTCQPIPLP